MDNSTPTENRERKLYLSKQQKLCGLCPYHRKENARKRPRTDKYKSRRKGRA